MRTKCKSSRQKKKDPVSGRDRDAVKAVMAKLKANDFGIDMQFDNYRTN